MTQPKHKQFAPKWSTEEDDILLRLHEQGATFAEIGRRLGRTEPAVKRRLYQLNIPAPLRDAATQPPPTSGEMYTHMFTGTKSPRYLKCLIHTKKK